jgi:hypothetical protein
VAPFLVLALPRSRTKWLSVFLSYKDAHCGHEELLRCRSFDDLRSWLAQPCTGSAETVAAPFWRLIPKLAPDARIVLVRRPVDEVVASLMRFGLFDAAGLTAAMRRADAKLDQVEARLPGVLRVDYAGLADEATCARVFEHCLPYPHDPAWWAACSAVNIQINLRQMMRYYTAHRVQIEKLAAQAKHRMLAGLAAPTEMDGISFQAEPFDAFYADAPALFREHLTQTEQHPDDHARKNLPLFRQMDAVGALHVWTARSNGRLFGYLVSVLAPSLDKPDERCAEQTIFFADPSWPRLGMRMQRAAIDDLKARGIDRVLMRAGHRGSGPRLGTMFRRMGAEPFGQLFNLPLGD